MPQSTRSHPSRLLFQRCPIRDRVHVAWHHAKRSIITRIIRHHIRPVLLLLFLPLLSARAQLVVDGSFEGLDIAAAVAAGFTPDWGSDNVDAIPLPGTMPGSWYSYLGSADIFWAPDYVPHNFMTTSGRTPFHGTKYGGISTGRFRGVWRGSETFGGTLNPPATAGRYLVRGRFAIGDFRNQPTFIKVSLVSSIAAAPDLVAGFQLIATSDWNLFAREVTVPAGARYDRIRIEGVDSLPNNWGAFCFIDSVDVDRLTPPCQAPTIDLGNDYTLCAGDSVTLTSTIAGGVPPYSYAWTPSTGLSCADCPAPRASPASSTTYYLTATGANGCSESRPVSVNIADQAAHRVSIPRTLTVSPGKVLLVPIMLDDSSDLSTIGRLTITLRYDARMLRLLPETTAKPWTSGGPLLRWSHGVETDRPGLFSITLIPPPDLPRGPSKGQLLLLRFSTFLGMRPDGTPIIASELPLEISTDAGCLAFAGRPGHVETALCGLEFRLMELTGGAKYAFTSLGPNPIASSGEARFSIGLDGDTRVELFNGTGHGVATLLEQHLEPGAYALPLDVSTLPSGLYYCRITSGAWSATRVMLIAK